ncbi:MAG: LacI family DNA-binding transcriptional regulator [Phycisphaeraceae bacterium]|nr:LacI family DNA-binding transcriptional regulator [Phycisphaeraceae bacterium]
MTISNTSITAIAQKLGVSHTTVSRVINGRSGVSADRASEIRRRLKEMGYRPKTVRPGPRLRHEAGLLTQRGTLVYLYLALEDKHLPMGLMNAVTAMSHAAAHAGFDLVFAHVSKLDDVPPCLREGRVAGLLLSGRTHDERLLHMLSGYPLVWLASRPKLHGAAGDRVIGGNQATGRLAAEYLLNRGHKHLAFLSPLSSWTVFEVRGDAFELAAHRRAASISRLTAPSDPDLAIFEFTQEQIEDKVAPLAAQLRDLSPRPTGLFIPDAPVALAFYRCAVKLGLSIGSDLDVITFGEPEVFHGLYPRPAIIAIPHELRVKRAINQLIWRIEHPQEHGEMEVAIEPHLIEGEIPAAKN